MKKLELYQEPLLEIESIVVEQGFTASLGEGSGTTEDVEMGEESGWN